MAAVQPPLNYNMNRTDYKHKPPLLSDLLINVVLDHAGGHDSKECQIMLFDRVSRPTTSIVSDSSRPFSLSPILSLGNSVCSQRTSNVECNSVTDRTSEGCKIVTSPTRKKNKKLYMSLNNEVSSTALSPIYTGKKRKNLETKKEEPVIVANITQFRGPEFPRRFSTGGSNQGIRISPLRCPKDDTEHVHVLSPHSETTCSQGRMRPRVNAGISMHPSVGSQHFRAFPRRNSTNSIFSTSTRFSQSWLERKFKLNISHCASSLESPRKVKFPSLVDEDNGERKGEIRIMDSPTPRFQRAPKGYKALQALTDVARSVASVSTTSSNSLSLKPDQLI